MWLTWKKGSPHLPTCFLGSNLVFCRQVMLKDGVSSHRLCCGGAVGVSKAGLRLGQLFLVLVLPVFLLTDNSLSFCTDQTSAFLPLMLHVLLKCLKEKMQLSAKAISLRVQEHTCSPC